MLAVLVIFEGNLIGVIVNEKISLHHYAGDHLRLLTTLANHAAVSIFNARLIDRLEATARTDPLRAWRIGARSNTHSSSGSTLHRPNRSQSS